MYIWFETTAFEEYSSIFNLCWFGVDKYRNEKEKQPMLDYHMYLIMKYPGSFFVKLVTCPICLIVWVAPLVFFIYKEDVSFPIICREIMFSWGMFFVLKMVIKKSD